MRDMVSTTPLAEYLDMLYVRLAIEMAKHEHVSRWWVEVHPPMFVDGKLLNEEDAGKVGFIKLKAFVGGKAVSYQADMNAVQRGMVVTTGVLERVIEMHLTKFFEALTP